MLAKMLNQNVDRTEKLQCNITLYYCTVKSAIYRDMHAPTRSFNLNKAWNITIYLISDLEAKYITCVII